MTPTHSTKLDAALFGKECGASDTSGCQFGYDQSEVKIILSGGKFGDGRCPKLSVGTVLAIIVKFDRPQPLENFRLKNRKEVLFDPSNPPNRGCKGYYYQQEGFIISTVEGRAVEVVYVAEQKDIHRCPEYYEDPKAFVEVWSPSGWAKPAIHASFTKSMPWLQPPT